MKEPLMHDHDIPGTDLLLPETPRARIVSRSGRWESPGDFNAWQAMASVIAADPTGSVPPELVDNPAGIIARMLQAQALDIPLWLAMQDLFTIVSKKTGRGKVGMSSELARGLLLRAGHSYDFPETTAKRCVFAVTRGDTGKTYETEWTIEEAELAGLREKNVNWQKYPKDMLVARASMRGSRHFAPDVTKGMGYEREELIHALQEDFYDGSDPEAQEAIAELCQAAADAEDKGTLTTIARDAQRRRLLNVYTDHKSEAGVLLPLRMFLHEQWRRVEAEERGEQVVEEGSGPVSESAPTPGLTPDPEVPAAEAPAAAECGCTHVEIVANGGHRKTCPVRVNLEGPAQ
jgi:hypothetical protein